MNNIKRYIKRPDGATFAVNGMKGEGDLPPPFKSSEYKVDGSKELPARVDLRPYCTTVEDQSQSNSCCANAAAGAYEYLCKRVAMENGDEVGDISRLFIYFVGRKNDQMRFGHETSLLVRDEGVTLSGAANALQAQGACLESTWPFDLSAVNERPSPGAFEQATDYKISEVKLIPVNERAMKECLAEGYPIVFGCKLTKPFFSAPGGKILTPDPSDPQSAEHGRHAMLIVGYSENEKNFIVRNSWGERWGDKGYCYMPFDYLCNPELNMGGMWSCRGLTDYDFTPEPQDDGQTLVDPAIEVNVDENAFETEEEKLPEPEVDPNGAHDFKMFDMRSVFKIMFDKFDTDKSGTVSKSECKDLLAKLGVPWFMANAAFSAMDKDGSGDLSEEEFVNAFGGLLGLNK